MRLMIQRRLLLRWRRLGLLLLLTEGNDRRSSQRGENGRASHKIAQHESALRLEIPVVHEIALRLKPTRDEVAGAEEGLATARYLEFGRRVELVLLL